MNKRKKQIQSLKYQAGISNIQIMVGVLISAILILGGMGMMRYIDKSKVNNDINELTELKARTVAYGSQHAGNLSGMTKELAIGLDFFPPNRVSGAVGSRAVSNQWKGDINLTPIGLVSAGDAIQFVYTGIPNSACKELAIAAGQIADVIWVGATQVKTGPLSPVNEAAAITACDANGDNTALAYTFSK